MSNVARLALVDPDENMRQKLKAMLLRIESLWLETDCSRYELFPGVIAQSVPDIAVVALDSDPEQAMLLVERLTKEHPSCVVLVASGSSDGHLILRALRAGAREFLALPLSQQELEAALARVNFQKFGPADLKQDVCQIIAVAGATGGVGCTSIASNLGCLLAHGPGRSVALLDLDLALGDADVLLNLIPEYTLADVVENDSQLDIQLLKESLTKHSSGLELLPRPVELRDAASISGEAIRRIIGLMRTSFSHLVIDLSKSYTSLDIVAMQLASRVVLVTQLDLPCLRNVVRLLMSFEEIDGLSEKIEIVVNRAGLESSQISLKKAKETLGREIYAMLPTDHRTMVAARNHGVPLLVQAPKAPITSALRDLATRLTATGEGEQEDAESAERRWSRFWPGTTKSKH